MNNKEARALIKTIINLTYELTELEYKKEMSFDDYLCSLGFGKPDYPQRHSFPTRPREHQLFEFENTEKREYAFWICLASAFVMLVAFFTSLGYINKPGFVVCMVIAGLCLVGIISGAVLRFIPKKWYEIKKGKKCSKEDAQKEVDRLNRTELDEYNSECEKINNEYEKRVKAYEQQLEKYNVAVKDKKDEYDSFIKKAKKEYQDIKKLLDSLLDKNDLSLYPIKTLETTLKVLNKYPSKELDEALKMADEIMYQEELAEHEARQRELREQEEIRRYHEQREVDRRRQEELLRRERDEHDRAELGALEDGRRLCMSCTVVGCNMRNHLKGNSCGGFKPRHF